MYTPNNLGFLFEEKQINLNQEFLLEKKTFLGFVVFFWELLSTKHPYWQWHFVTDIYWMLCWCHQFSVFANLKLKKNHIQYKMSQLCMVCGKATVRLFKIKKTNGSVKHTIEDDMVEIFGSRVHKFTN